MVTSFTDWPDSADDLKDELDIGAELQSQRHGAAGTTPTSTPAPDSSLADGRADQSLGAQDSCKADSSR